MKHKHKIGDKVLGIWNTDQGLTVDKFTIESDRRGDLRYKFKWGTSTMSIHESKLYTKAEAIEFITNYINKGE